MVLTNWNWSIQIQYDSSFREKGLDSALYTKAVQGQAI